MSEAVAMPDDPVGGSWKSRIVGHGFEDPEALLANPFNHRIHPAVQQKAMEGSLEEIGWIQSVIVNQRTEHIIDGHMRVLLAQRSGERRVPVSYVELTPQEERIALATYDRIGSMAVPDQEMMRELLDQIPTVDSEGLSAMIDGMREAFSASVPVDQDEDQGEAKESRSAGRGEAVEVECPNCGHHWVPTDDPSGEFD